MDSKNKIISNASGGASASVSDALGNVIASSYIADVSWDSETRVLSCLGASGNVIGSVEIPSRTLVDDVTKPLMFRAVEDNSSIRLNAGGIGSPYTGTCEYSFDNRDWSSYTYGTRINLNEGDCVYFKVTNFGTKSSGSYCQFSMGGTIEAWHNVNSMVSPNFASLTDLSSVGVYTLAFLFKSCKKLVKAPLLPATKLAESCYTQMFYGCTGLTQAPELSATILAYECCSEMFYGCTGLTQSPALHATTIARFCCSKMFYGCTGLTQAPALPATKLVSYCYIEMFRGCTGLTQAPALPATKLEAYCYSQMFQNCSSLNAVTCHAKTLDTNCTQDWLDGVAATGDFYTPQATNWSSGASGCPANWTRHDI